MKLPNKAIIKIEYNDEIREYVFDINELNNIIKEKQARIDKAIKFINTHDLYHPTNEVILLNILKGSDKE